MDGAKVFLRQFLLVIGMLRLEESKREKGRDEIRKMGIEKGKDEVQESENNDGCCCCMLNIIIQKIIFI